MYCYYLTSYLKDILPAKELFTARYLFRAVPEIGEMFVTWFFYGGNWAPKQIVWVMVCNAIEKKGMVEIASIAQHVVMKNELGITKWMLWSFLERTIALAKHPATKTETLPSWELAYPFPKVVLKIFFPRWAQVGYVKCYFHGGYSIISGVRSFEIFHCLNM